MKMFAYIAHLSTWLHIVCRIMYVRIQASDEGKENADDGKMYEKLQFIL